MRPNNYSSLGRFSLSFAAVIFVSIGGCRAQQSTSDPRPLADAPAQSAAEGKNFFTRGAEYYRQDWSPGTASSAPAPARRGLPSPLDSPPFPNSDWSYGGSPVIGEPDTNSYPLMTAINQSRSRTKLYGWLDPTLNFSTSTNSNAPEANDVYSNRFELNQFVLYAERLPDSVQQNHVDGGYHLTALYGTDYRFTVAKGYLSSRWLNGHHEYGFDPTLEYVDVYIPQVAQGMNLRFGRFISVPGIEAQLAPNNYIFSHSLLYAIDPFTDTGLIATVKVNDRWLLQLGITAGHDVALWTPDATCLLWEARFSRRSAPTRRTACRENSVARRPNMPWLTFCRRNSQRMTSCRFAATFSMTKKASAPDTRHDTPRTRSCGVIGCAPRCRSVRNCDSNGPGI